MDAESDGITADRLVEVIVSDAYLSAVAGSVRNMESPPGSAPSERLLHLHRWFVALPPEQKDMVERAMAYAADGAVFGVLCMLDNVRPVANSFREKLRLTVVSDGVERDLVPDGGYEELHGLFRSRVHELG